MYRVLLLLLIKNERITGSRKFSLFLSLKILTELFSAREDVVGLEASIGLFVVVVMIAGAVVEVTEGGSGGLVVVDAFRVVVDCGVEDV